MQTPNPGSLPKTPSEPKQFIANTLTLNIRSIGRQQQKNQPENRGKSMRKKTTREIHVNVKKCFFPQKSILVFSFGIAR